VKNGGPAIEEVSQKCDENSECSAKDGILKCYCKDGFEGDGSTCQPSEGTLYCHSD